MTEKARLNYSKTWLISAFVLIVITRLFGYDAGWLTVGFYLCGSIDRYLEHRQDIQERRGWEGKP